MAVLVSVPPSSFRVGVGSGVRVLVQLVFLVFIIIVILVSLIHVNGRNVTVSLIEVAFPITRSGWTMSAMVTMFPIMRMVRW